MFLLVFAVKVIAQEVLLNLEIMLKGRLLSSMLCIPVVLTIGLCYVCRCVTGSCPFMWSRETTGPSLREKVWSPSQASSTAHWLSPESAPERAEPSGKRLLLLLFFTLNLLLSPDKPKYCLGVLKHACLWFLRTSQPQSSLFLLIFLIFLIS